MKIAILNGSPKIGNTAAMVNAFAEGAKAAGHDVEILQKARMKKNSQRSAHLLRACKEGGWQ